MMPTERVTFTTPDGVEREMRFTLGARRRIAESFKQPDVKAILSVVGDGALPEIAYAMMYDANGDPPKGLSLKQFQEGVDDAVPLLAAIMGAVAKGATPKNEIEALLRTAQRMEVEKLIGSTLGVSQGSASDSEMPNSGTSPSENLRPSAIDTEIASGSPTIAPV